MKGKQLQAIVIGILAIAILSPFIYYKYLVKPLKIEHDKVDVELKNIEDKYKQSVSRAARLPQLQKEIEVLKIEIVEMQGKLPKDKNVPSLIRLMGDKMKQYGITWTEMNPGKTPISQEHYLEHHYKIPFSAPYHNLAQFLAEIGQEDRIFSTKLSSLVKKDTPEKGILVGGDITFQIYTSK